jgi:hypothetical protein
MQHMNRGAERRFLQTYIMLLFVATAEQAELQTEQQLNRTHEL